MSRSDSAEVLQPAEHALEGVAVAVEEQRETVLPAPVSLGLDVLGGSLVLDDLLHPVSVIAFVGMDDTLCWQRIEKRFAAATVRGIVVQRW